MSVSLEQLQAWLDAVEDEHLEFKAAKEQYHFDELVKYCVALANEGGGKFILGVGDKPPRKVVGTQGFKDLQRAKEGLNQLLHMRIDADEIQHPDGRVVVFHVPSRPIGLPIQYKGRYWMRAGEALVPMTPDMLKGIFEEAVTDFSAEVCPKAAMADLAPAAIEEFRSRWIRKSGNQALGQLSPERLLSDAELIVDDGVTYAALILLACHETLGKYLAQAEVVFEYRSSEGSGPPQQRKDYREGFFLFYDDLWNNVNLRNEVQHFQDGLFIWNVHTFNEAVVREAILNAASHRDYRLSGSVFVRQYPRKMEVVSPGGFPPGITVENILWRQAPRNRRIAEVFAKCGLVERSGQGVNRMFEECIKESKPKPDFTGTDDYQVSVTLHCQVQDRQFLRFLEKVGRERLSTFATEDFLVLDMVNREQAIPENIQPRIHGLLEQGVIERMGRGRGVRYILSRQFYDFLGRRGVYTRKRGLDRQTNKELLLSHIKYNEKHGSQFREFRQVLPQLSRHQISNLLRELKAEGRIHNAGTTKSARWYPGAAPNSISSKSANKSTKTQ